jgi:uncharacterized protein (DUF433 family)
MKYGAISIEPERMSGAPCFVGTRVPIKYLFDYLAGNDTIEDFLESYPHIPKKDVVRVLNMAKKLLTSEKILNENFRR